MSATILEIARRLNLSHSTVSRVLTGNKNTPIAEETRQRVLVAAREMGYRPNLAARSMRDARTNLVALFSEPEVGIWSSIGPDIVRAIAPILKARRLDLFYAFAMATSSDEIPSLPPWRYDAAIILQHPTEETVERIRASRYPCIAVNEQIPGFSCVIPDEEDGVRQAIEHLYSLGHRRIAYANASSDFHLPHHSINEREMSYLAVLQEFGLVPISWYAWRPYKEERVNFLRHAFVEERATAILCYDHVVTMDILSAAEALRIRIPTDMSLVSFNNVFPLERLNPTVTVIDLAGAKLGQEAALRLIDLLEGKSPEQPTTIRIKPRLEVRRSSTAL